MQLTVNSDLFASVREGALNRLLRHVQHQRPSQFNYATKLLLDRAVAQNPPQLCQRIEFSPEVIEFNNPLISEVDPLPVAGSSPPLGLNYCLQFEIVGVDFHPGKTLTLPPELSPLRP